MMGVPIASVGSKALMSGEWSWIVMSMDMEVDLSLLRYCVFVIFIWENPRSHSDVSAGRERRPGYPKKDSTQAAITH